MHRVLATSAVTLAALGALSACSSDAAPVQVTTHVAPATPPATLAQVGVPKLVTDHDGAKVDVTLEAVHWVPTINNMGDITGIYVFTIKNVGAKPFQWNENQLSSEDGSLAYVNAPRGNNDPSLLSFDDTSNDLTAFSKLGQPILIGTVKPGGILRGIVTASNALDQAS